MYDAYVNILHMLIYTIHIYVLYLYIHICIHRGDSNYIPNTVTLGGTLENRSLSATTTDVPLYTQLLQPPTQPSAHTQASTASGSISQISTTSTLKMEYSPRLLLLSGMCYMIICTYTTYNILMRWLYL